MRRKGRSAGKPRKESGWDGKQRRKREAEQARRDEAARRAALQRGDDLPPHLAHFAEVGPPPLDANQGILWANRLAQALAWEVATDPVIDAKERRKTLTELTRAIGTTSSRAALEESLAKVEAAIDSIRHHVGAVRIESTAGVPRSPGARGGSRSRLPRAVETPPREPLRDSDTPPTEKH